jgi:hypothetical protein
VLNRKEQREITKLWRVPADAARTSGRVRMKVIPDFKAKTIIPFLHQNVSPGSTISWAIDNRIETPPVFEFALDLMTEMACRHH